MLQISPATDLEPCRTGRVGRTGRTGEYHLPARRERDTAAADTEGDEGLNRYEHRDDCRTARHHEQLPDDHVAATRPSSFLKRSARHPPTPTLRRMPEWWDSVWPVITFVVGIASTFFLGALGARWQRTREAAARNDEHNRLLRERREAFELKTLEDLTPSIRAFAGAAWKVHHLSTREPSADGNINESKVPKDHIHKMIEAERDVRVLAERILDDNLRQAVIAAVDQMDIVDLLEPQPVEDARRFWHTGSKVLEAARENASTHMRKIYLAREPTPKAALVPPT